MGLTPCLVTQTCSRPRLWAAEELEKAQGCQDGLQEAAEERLECGLGRSDLPAQPGEAEVALRAGGCEALRLYQGTHVGSSLVGGCPPQQRLGAFSGLRCGQEEGTEFT